MDSLVKYVLPQRDLAKFPHFRTIQQSDRKF